MKGRKEREGEREREERTEVEGQEGIERGGREEGKKGKKDTNEKQWLFSIAGQMDTPRKALNSEKKNLTV